MGVVTICAVVTFILPHWMSHRSPLSPVSGLRIQKILAQDSVPYQVALASGKPTLIEFYADWCSSCQSFAPTLKAVHEQVGDRVNVVMLDIDDPQWRKPIQQFHATGVPHLTLLDSDHSVAESWTGKVPQSLLLDRIESILT